MTKHEDMAVRHLRALGVYHYEMAIRVANDEPGKLPPFNTWVARNQEMLKDAKQWERVVERLNKLPLMLVHAEDALKYLRALNRKLEKQHEVK